MIKNCVMILFLAVVADNFAEVPVNLANEMAFSGNLL